MSEIWNASAAPTRRRSRFLGWIEYKHVVFVRRVLCHVKSIELVDINFRFYDIRSDDD